MKNYLILNNEGFVIDEANTPYEATKKANARADFNRQIYYVFNISTQTCKPCYGFNIYKNSCNGYGNGRYIVK